MAVLTRRTARCGLLAQALLNGNNAGNGQIHEDRNLLVFVQKGCCIQVSIVLGEIATVSVAVGIVRVDRA